MTAIVTLHLENGLRTRRNPEGGRDVQPIVALHRKDSVVGMAVKDRAQRHVRRALPMRRRVVILLSASIVGFAGLVLATPLPAYAHCGSLLVGHSDYVSGGNATNTVRSVRTTMDWLDNPQVCSSGTSYSISIDHNPGWVQVGWRRYYNQNRTMGYCERSPEPGGAGSYVLSEYSVPQQTQRYQYLKSLSTSYFECSINGDFKVTNSPEFLGFEHGGSVPVQAEAHQVHQQLGRTAPAWFVFSDTEKILTGATAWTSMNVNSVQKDEALWNFTQPSSTGFKVNTNAMH